MKAIILAAGKGNRLKQYTKEKPKCLLELGTETILSREIRQLQEEGIKKDNIFVVGGYKFEMLRKEAPNLLINRYYDTKDNAYSLGMALETVCDDDIIVFDGDLCFENLLLRELIQDKNQNILMSKVSSDLDESTGICIGEDGFVEAIGKQYNNTGFVYLSIFKISKDVIPAFKDSLLREKNAKTWYTAAITEICKQYKFVNKITEQKWHEIDFIEDYIETLEMFNLGVNS